MRGDDLLGDVEAQPQAGGIGIGFSVIELIKGIEELRYHLGGNRSALVVHRNFDIIAVALGGYGHGRFDGAMLNGIADEIGYNLP